MEHPPTVVATPAAGRDVGEPAPSNPPPRRSSWIRRNLLRLFLAAAAGLVLVPTAGAVTIWWYGRGLQDVDVSKVRAYRPPQNTRVLARDGRLLGELVFGERRIVVPYDAVPQHVVQAFLAAEDADFFAHEGMDVLGMLRAAWVNLQSGELKQGASTITQQVVKNLLLSPERSVERKSKEILLARRLEHELDKADILAVYLNEIYLGEGRYGVEAASRHYFGKSVRAIDLAEGATLAALPKAPGKITPFRDPEHTRARRDWVLDRMVAQGFATIEEVRAAKREPLPDRPAAEVDPTLAPEVVAFVHRELVSRYGEEHLATLGAEVTTTIDPALQKVARKAVRTRLEQLVDRHHGYGRRPYPLSQEERARIERLAPTDLEPGGFHTVALVDSGDLRLPQGTVAAALGSHRLVVSVADALEPGRSANEMFPSGHGIMVRILSAAGSSPDVPAGWAFAVLAEAPEAAVVLAEVDTGDVLAFVGGKEVTPGGFDRVTQARRQPASTFKPFVTAAALAARTVTPASVLPGQDGPIRLRDAIARSDNVAAAAVLEGVGHAAVLATTEALGFDTRFRPLPSLALGAQEVSLWELLTGYLTVARAGAAIGPSVISEINVSGHAPWRSTAVRHEGIDSSVAFLVTSMLASVVEEGTASAAKVLERFVAGKTGTSNRARDAWFAGYTRRHVAVAWVGFDHRPSLGRRESGGTVALPIWLDVMASVSRGLPKETFDRPAGVVSRTIDRRTGGPACTVRNTWHVEGVCSGFWIFETCRPPRDVPHAPYLRCVDPMEWLDELFLADTGPQHADVVPSMTGSGVRIERLSLFQPVESEQSALSEFRREEAAVLRPMIEELEAAWSRFVTRWPEGRAPTSRVALVGVQLQRDGAKARVRLVRSSGDQRVDAAALAAIDSIPPRPLPDGLIDPEHRVADLLLAFRLDSDRSAGSSP